MLDAKVRKTRKVNIIDNISPVIKVDNEVIQICPNEEVSDFKYEAIDEYDGDITSRVERAINDNEVLLSVDDFSHNSTSLTIKINRVDAEKPVIKLEGNSVMYLTYGSVYKEPGYTASDNCDGDLTSKVVVSGNVGRNIGSYEIRYEVVDNSGNKSSVTRKVIIGANIKDNGIVNKGVIYLTFDDLNKVSNRVKRITGIDSKIIRFPGGSSNTISRNYNKGIMTELSNIVLNQGYRYFDWNVDAMDASSARNSNDVYYNVTSNLSFDRANVVLMHDTKSITVSALRDIIKFGKEYGYKFDSIDMNTYMVRHKVNN